MKKKSAVRQKTPLQDMYNRLQVIGRCTFQPNNLLDAENDPAIEELYMSTVKKYEKQELQTFADCIGLLTIHALDNQYDDIFGRFYEEHLSDIHRGQFFTPEEVCTLMAMMTIDRQTEKKIIADSSCGSGRNLLAAAKIAPKNLFLGADINITCVHMTLLNMYFSGMTGEVAWMDSLANVVWKAWRVNWPIGIQPIQPEQSYALSICQSRTRSFQRGNLLTLF